MLQSSPRVRGTITAEQREHRSRSPTLTGRSASRALATEPIVRGCGMGLVDSTMFGSPSCERPLGALPLYPLDRAPPGPHERSRITP
jgi:hypothetical protein